ncbi:MAG: LamG domain-containing protein [Deltaproteobacteria bacterium]|nr:LamG domain-containing protein [Kofleriaceae bacterium]
MITAERTRIIRAGLGGAVKATLALGLVACGFSPAGGSGDLPDAAPGDAPLTTIDADEPPRAFCDREDPDLRLCLTFEQGAADEAGAGAVVDRAANLGFGPGRVGGAVQLSSSSDLHVAETPALDVTTALTMEAFVLVAEAPANRAGIMDNNGQWGMWIGSNMRPYCTLVGSTVSGPTIAAATWTHVACVFDGQTYRIYVDGALFGTVNRQVPASTAGLDGVNVGQDCTPTGANDPLTGGLDEVRVWASARSDAQLAAAAARTE